VLIATAPGSHEVEGRTIAELAAARKQAGEDVMIDLLLAGDGQVSMIHFLMSEPNVARGLTQPWVTIGSDNGELCAGPPEGHPGKPHPRQHGCFPRVLGTYVREQGVLSWQDAVHRMTGRAAATLGLADRGILRPGTAADVVVFDPRTVADVATYADPHRYPTGIPWVWVNGAAMVEDGRFTPRPAGRVLSAA
jgi:N-acyl-D-aspartate/D-glutamate deacylase